MDFYETFCEWSTPEYLSRLQFEDTLWSTYLHQGPSQTTVTSVLYIIDIMHEDIMISNEICQRYTLYRVLLLCLYMK